MYVIALCAVSALCCTHSITICVVTALAYCLCRNMNIKQQEGKQSSCSATLPFWTHVNMIPSNLVYNFVGIYLSHSLTLCRERRSVETQNYNSPTPFTGFRSLYVSSRVVNFCSLYKVDYRYYLLWLFCKFILLNYLFSNLSKLDTEQHFDLKFYIYC